MISFDDLPNDIKIRILSINEENNFKIHKQKYFDVIESIEEINDYLFYNYCESDFINFSNAMLEVIEDQGYNT